MENAKHYRLKKDVILNNGKEYIEGYTLFLYHVTNFECYLRDENTGHLALIVHPSEFEKMFEPVEVDAERYFIKNVELILDNIKELFIGDSKPSRIEARIIEDMEMGRPGCAFYDIQNHLDKESDIFKVLKNFDINVTQSESDKDKEEK